MEEEFEKIREKVQKIKEAVSRIEIEDTTFTGDQFCEEKQFSTTVEEITGIAKKIVEDVVPTVIERVSSTPHMGLCNNDLDLEELVEDVREVHAEVTETVVELVNDIGEIVEEIVESIQEVVEDSFEVWS